MYSKTLYLNSILLPYGKPLVFPIKKNNNASVRNCSPNNTRNYFSSYFVMRDYAVPN